MKQKIIPDDILNTIFSFFKNPREIAVLNRVCKQWNRLANNNSLWTQFVRKELLEDLKKSGLTAKEFLKRYPDARLGTLYCLGSSIKVCDIPGLSGPKKPIPLTKEELLATFQPDEQGFYRVFIDRNLAIACADAISNDNRINDTTAIAGYYFYTPIFTVRIQDISLVEKAESAVLEVRKNSFYIDEEGYDHFNYKKMILDPSTQIIDIFYKAGHEPYHRELKVRKSANHLVTLNIELSDLNESKESSRCLIS